MQQLYMEGLKGIFLAFDISAPRVLQFWSNKGLGFAYFLMKTSKYMKDT